MSQENQPLKPFLRVFNTDLVGDKPIVLALQKVNGLGFSLANAICNVLNISKTTKAGLISDVDVKRIEQLVKENKMPIWVLNRRNDTTTAETGHLIGADLKFTVENDIKRMRRLKTYKGLRHSIGQPTRGQRTRSHFRHGRAVGVMKTKVAKTVASAASDKKDKKDKK